MWLLRLRTPLFKGTQIGILAVSIGLWGGSSPRPLEARAGIRHEKPISPTSVGPTSDEEAELLWKEGEKNFLAKHYEEAIIFLQRLTDRYPNRPGYLKSHFYLGKSYLENGDAKEAIPSLKFYVSGSGRTQEATQGLTELGRAYLSLQKFHEAYLTSIEIERLVATLTGSDPHLLQVFKIRGLMLKTRALLGLNQEVSASQALAAAKKLWDGKDFAVAGELALTELNVKSKKCGSFPGQGVFNETQLRDQLDRRGTCLLEALLVFRETLKAQDPQVIQLAKEAVNHDFETYSKACSRSYLPPGKRLARQVKRFQEELIELLHQGCRVKVSHALELLQEIRKNSEHLSNDAMQGLSQVSKKLQKIADEELATP